MDYNYKVKSGPKTIKDIQSRLTIIKNTVNNLKKVNHFIKFNKYYRVMNLYSFL